ncbi:MAG: DUF2939 domain-containing protein [Bdellovibrionales bacterium]
MNLLFIIILAGLGGYQDWVRSPGHSLQNLAEALRGHDVAEVKKYIDVDRVVISAIDQFSAGLPEQAPDGDWAFADETLSRGLVEMIRPQLAEVLKSRFLDFVSSGEYDDYNSGAGLSSEIHRLIEGDVVFEGVRAVRRSGGHAYVTIALVAADGQRRWPEILLIQQPEGHWQVAEILNLKALISEVPTTKIGMSGL